MNPPGMNSEKLSRRSKQPGDDQTFRASEANFIEVAMDYLDLAKYHVEEQPSDLLHIFDDGTEDRKLGIKPDAVIKSLKTKRRFYIEVKKQGPRGNAEERAYKHHTVQFTKTLRNLYNYEYHPYVTVFCDDLAINRRYTCKFKYLIEPDNYFLWVRYNVSKLEKYLEDRCVAWLN